MFASFWFIPVRVLLMWPQARPPAPHGHFPWVTTQSLCRHQEHEWGKWQRNWWWGNQSCTLEPLQDQALASFLNEGAFLPWWSFTAALGASCLGTLSCSSLRESLCCRDSQNLTGTAHRIHCLCCLCQRRGRICTFFIVIISHIRLPPPGNLSSSRVVILSQANCSSFGDALVVPEPKHQHRGLFWAVSPAGQLCVTRGCTDHR